MTIAFSTPTTEQQRQHQAHKARQQRFAEAARRVRREQPVIAIPYCRPQMAKKIPLWQMEEIHFDAHTTAFKLWKAEILAVSGSPLKAYIRRRCQEMEIDFCKVMSKSRRREITNVRQLLMWEIRTLIRPGMSMPEIGRLFGGRDHTTVLHAIRRVAEMKARGE